ncbi:hypothetical protein COT49_00470 [candidate division WWE3 bacterium CG08_land_8_20_14_0_20_40_13]|uniref:Asl1-like glycosyl hydrolase catalytic domain-containing protein n=1 Tax=candidate division WWE3 bacterium CG08_land_8_20_14_0_20_40_13 TaxID=1975084 RepID=A0A2H0XGN2_UNCKA|nr:MAG: hypothetical protein COT49_00470 [candidate division WWE3 bacterium CG08_land_8_20_14_0_20_40_13]
MRKTTLFLTVIALLLTATLTVALERPLFLNLFSPPSISGKPSVVKNLDIQNLPSGIFKKPCFDKPMTYNGNLGNPQQNIGYQNNKFGLYIYAEVDYVEYAGDMVNSNGGDWGYVLLPINVKDYEASKWTKIFELLNQKHLIPIIQLWDLTKKEQEEQIAQSAYFLNSLPWPTKNRYISVYNEVNDDRFWRGKADPIAYAEILSATIDSFKRVNPNFFMLNGAFNASARSGPGYIDEEEFLLKMDKAVPGIFKKLDGWASHPYPQPEYRGSPYSSGRDSIKAYEWELALLAKHFNVKDPPIFITETGWAHKEGEDENTKYFSKETVAEFYKIAFREIWLPDQRIVAVAPFTIKYPAPNDHFSFLDKDEKPYPQYKVLQEIEKIPGLPPFVLERGDACN